MQLINQRTDKDCGIACLAMYTEKTYDEIKKTMAELNIAEPLSADVTMKVLKHYGYKPVVLRTWVWQAKGILAVPSLNFPGLNHVVCWTGDCKDGKVLDPQDGRDGKKAYTSEQMLNGKSGWVDFIGDVRDENVMIFAKMEKHDLEQAMAQIGDIQ